MAGVVMWVVVQLLIVGLVFYGAVRMFRYGGWLGMLAGLILVTQGMVVLWLVVKQ
jgi:hypothetical protein